MTDALSHIANPDIPRRSRSFATSMRQARRYSIGGRPMMRMNRSKKPEHDSAAVFAS